VAVREILAATAASIVPATAAGTLDAAPADRPA